MENESKKVVKIFMDNYPSLELMANSDNFVNLDFMQKYQKNSSQLEGDLNFLCEKNMVVKKEDPTGYKMETRGKIVFESLETADRIIRSSRK